MDPTLSVMTMNTRMIMSWMIMKMFRMTITRRMMIYGMMGLLLGKSGLRIQLFDDWVQG